MNKEIALAVDFLRKNDKVIGKLIKDIGPCSISPSVDYFRSLMRAIISQQLSNKASNTIYKRFLLCLKNDLSPNSVIKLTDSEFKSAGISNQKMAYLQDIAKKFIEDMPFFDSIDKLDDEEIISHLTKIKGIGRWSAEMFLIFCLNRLNVLPLDDVAFRKALSIFYNLDKVPDNDKIMKISTKWGQFKSIAVWYLWQSLNRK